MNPVEVLILSVVGLVVIAVFSDSSRPSSTSVDDQAPPATYILGWLFTIGGFIGLEATSGDLKDAFLYVCMLGLLFVCAISLGDRLSGKKEMFSYWSEDSNVIGDAEGVILAGLILLMMPTMLSRHGYFERFLLPAHTTQPAPAAVTPVATARPPVQRISTANTAKTPPVAGSRKKGGIKTTAKHNHVGQKNEHANSRTINSTTRDRGVSAR